MEGEEYPFAIREVDRRVGEIVTRVNILEAGRETNTSAIRVLESQREDMREDINRIGDSVRQLQGKLEDKMDEHAREVKNDIADLRTELVRRDKRQDSSTLGQRVAYISAAGAVVASLLIALATIFGHA